MTKRLTTRIEKLEKDNLMLKRAVDKLINQQSQIINQLNLWKKIVAMTGLSVSDLRKELVIMQLELEEEKDEI